MLRPLVALACIGLAPLRRSRIGPAERRAVMGWLARTAPRWGRGRWWAVLAAAVGLTLALALGSAMSIPVYRSLYRDAVGSPPESTGELVEFLTQTRITDYWWIVSAHALLVAAAGLLMLLVHLRLGARAALLRREQCTRCRHDLTGLPIDSASPTVRCTECGRPNPAIAAWNELSRDAAGRATFAPATNLVRVFWTRRRAVLAGKLAAALLAVSLLAWGGVWGWKYADSHRQAAAARAARLTPAQITERVNALMPTRATARAVAAGAGDSRLDIAQRIADRSRGVADAYNARHALRGLEGPSRQVWVEHAWSFRPADRGGDDGQATATHAAALLEDLRADGLASLLDALAVAPMPPPFQFVPEDSGGVTVTHLGAVRQAARVNAAFLRCAVSVGDVVGFRQRLETALSLCELSSDGPFLINALVAAALVQMLAEHLDWASRTRHASVPRDEWFDAIDGALARVESLDAAGTLRRERLYVLDNLAAHFSDPTRVRRGMADPAIADSPDVGAMLAALNDRPGTTLAPARLGSFDANARAINAAFDGMVDAASTPVWRPERYDASSLERSPLHFVRQVSSLPSMTRGLDAANLRLRSVRIAARIERFRAANGRVPTPDELPAAVGPGIDLTDPYTGKPLGYRTTNLPKLPDRWPARGYLLYAAGLDGVDHGGIIPSRQVDLPTRSAEGETDLILPDALLSP